MHSACVPARAAPLAIARAISTPPLLHVARLGHIGATAQHRLPLGQEAKKRLRCIVEGFFFRRLRSEDAKRIRRLLVKSPPGLGKTRVAIASAVHYQAEQEGKGLLSLPRGEQATFAEKSGIQYAIDFGFLRVSHARKKAR
jgi:hypothetical protein